jgi:formamidopyrimidine-DNA glycosylase
VATVIELPEAMVLAEQLSREVRGKQIQTGVFGSTPHKWAFSSRPAEEYAAILAGKMIGEAAARGSAIVMPVEPDYALVLGGGGQRILLHADASSLPKKHQLLLEFADGAFLTVTVQGWGSVLLLDEGDVAEHPWCGGAQVSPISDAFTYEYFQGLFGKLESEAHSVKYFAISKPGISGVGNGYLQDILYRAKLHPRRRAVSLSRKERRAFYNATRKTLREAVKLGGRDSERDLHDRPGRYRRLLDSTKVGQPCAECGAGIRKISFLGGACYFCPQCQPA